MSLKGTLLPCHGAVSAGTGLTPFVQSGFTSVTRASPPRVVWGLMEPGSLMRNVLRGFLLPLDLCSCKDLVKCLCVS